MLWGGQYNNLDGSETAALEYSYPMPGHDRVLPVPLPEGTRITAQSQDDGHIGFLYLRTQPYFGNNLYAEIWHGTYAVIHHRVTTYDLDGIPSNWYLVAYNDGRGINGDTPFYRYWVSESACIQTDFNEYIYEGCEV